MWLLRMRTEQDLHAAVELAARGRGIARAGLTLAVAGGAEAAGSNAAGCEVARDRVGALL